MSGLILKDLLNLKRNLKTLLLMLVVFAVIFVPQGTSSAFTAMLVFVSSTLVVTTMSYDDLAKWDRYALTMPVTRRDMVRAKYAVLLILAGIGAAVGAIVELAAGMLLHSAPRPQEMLLSILAVLSISLLLSAVILPLLYHFGVEKARIMMMLVLLLPLLLILGSQYLFELTGLPMPPERTVTAVLAVLPLAAVLGLALSYHVSVHIYRKKDL